MIEKAITDFLNTESEARNEVASFVYEYTEGFAPDKLEELIKDFSEIVAPEITERIRAILCNFLECEPQKVANIFAEPPKRRARRLATLCANILRKHNIEINVETLILAVAMLAKEARTRGLIPTPEDPPILICPEEQRERIMQRLRELMRGRKGKHVALVVTAAQELHLMGSPSFAELQKYFQVYGSRQAFEKAMANIIYEPKKYARLLAPYIAQLKAA